MHIKKKDYKKLLVKKKDYEDLVKKYDTLYQSYCEFCDQTQEYVSILRSRLKTLKVIESSLEEYPSREEHKLLEIMKRITELDLCTSTHIVHDSKGKLIVDPQQIPRDFREVINELQKLIYQFKRDNKDVHCKGDKVVTISPDLLPKDIENPVGEVTDIFYEGGRIRCEVDFSGTKILYQPDQIIQKRG